MIGLQHWFDFCHTSTCINHRCTYVPSLLNLPPISHPFLLFQVITEPQLEFPESQSKFPLAVCFHMLVHHLSVQFHMLLKALFLKIRRNSHFLSFSQVCLNLWVYFFLNLSVEFNYMPVFFRYIKNGAFSDSRQLSIATKAGK